MSEQEPQPILAQAEAVASGKRARAKDAVLAASAYLGEHYQDFLIIVREPNGSNSWRSSNAAWGVGAAEDYAGTQRAVIGMRAAARFGRQIHEEGGQ